jgi:hypothetical protein
MITATRRKGADVKIGDLINVGIGQRIGRVVEFMQHNDLPDGITGRVAVTDRGSITVIDCQLIEVFN